MIDRDRLLISMLRGQPVPAPSPDPEAARLAAVLNLPLADLAGLPPAMRERLARVAAQLESAQHERPAPRVERANAADAPADDTAKPHDERAGADAAKPRDDAAPVHDDTPRAVERAAGGP